MPVFSASSGSPCWPACRPGRRRSSGLAPSGWSAAPRPARRPCACAAGNSRARVDSTEFPAVLAGAAEGRRRRDDALADQRVFQGLAAGDRARQDLDDDRAVAGGVGPVGVPLGVPAVAVGAAADDGSQEDDDARPSPPCPPGCAASSSSAADGRTRRRRRRSRGRNRYAGRRRRPAPARRHGRRPGRGGALRWSRPPGPASRAGLCPGHGRRTAAGEMGRIRLTGIARSVARLPGLILSALVLAPRILAGQARKAAPGIRAVVMLVMSPAELVSPRPAVLPGAAAAARLAGCAVPRVRVSRPDSRRARRRGRARRKDLAHRNCQDHRSWPGRRNHVRHGRLAE